MNVALLVMEDRRSAGMRNINSAKIVDQISTKADMCVAQK